MTNSHQIERCNKEIAEILHRIHVGEEPVDGLLLGLNDWRREKELLEGTSISLIRGEG